MNKEFFDALKLLEQEKNINLDELTERIKNAISIAIKKDYGSSSNVVIDLNIDENVFNVNILKDVVEEVEDESTQISLSDALRYDFNARIGYPILIKLDTKKFGRIAALSAKHVIKQGIRDAEKNRLYECMKEKEHTVVSAVVSKIDPQRFNVTVLIDSFEILLPGSEQMPNESFVEGDVIKLYVSEVTKTERGPKIVISRNAPELVRFLFEVEVPEIRKGLIEIKSIVREAGVRTKISVDSNNELIDPVGSCVGVKGVRVNKIVEELNDEKIDIIQYSDNYVEYITAALSPTIVKDIIVDPSAPKACCVIVPENQLSLAIGAQGQNVRLAAKLTGWKLDIKPECMMDEIKTEMSRKKAILEESLRSANENADEFYENDKEKVEENSDVVDAENIEDTDSNIQEISNVDEEQAEKISENIE